MELQIIQNKIHEIRGYRVILDFDLADMYEVETKYLKRSVKNNIERFPTDFMFELTKNEWESLRCKNCTSNTVNGRGGIRYMPYAFTEQGVAMLSSVLKSEVAINVNIAIMRAFVAIRQLILNNKSILKIEELEERIIRLEQCVEIGFKNNNEINEDTRTQIEYIYDILGELQTVQKQPETPRKPIGFKIPD